MNKITIEWTILDQVVSQTVSLGQNTILPDAIRIGRDTSKCDIALSHPDPNIERTVSGLHAEIVLDPLKSGFKVRNLTADREPPRQPNPVVIDGVKIIKEEAYLEVNSTIHLGRMILKIRAIELEQKTSDVQYMLRCSNIKTPHFWPLSYSKMTCDTCGCNIIGATQIFSP